MRAVAHSRDGMALAAQTASNLFTSLLKRLASQRPLRKNQYQQCDHPDRYRSCRDVPVSHVTPNVSSPLRSRLRSSC